MKKNIQLNYEQIKVNQKSEILTCDRPNTLFTRE